MKQYLHNIFSSLKNRNYRIYYLGQIVSVSGTFLQYLAQVWLVLKLSNSGTMLGLVLTFQFLPVLLFTSWGGLLADRYPKQMLLYITQTLSGILSLILGLIWSATVSAINRLDDVMVKMQGDTTNLQELSDIVGSKTLITEPYHDAVFFIIVCFWIFAIIDAYRIGRQREFQDEEASR